MVFTCEGLHTPLTSIPGKHDYVCPCLQDHPTLTTASSHQTRDEPVNLRESFEEDSSYRAIQVISCKKKVKQLKGIQRELQGWKPGCCHGKQAEV